MTRGKKAASAAKGRAEAAEQRLAELKAKYDEEKAAWTMERSDLRNEVQRLSNRLVSEVKDLADREVQKARTAVTLELKTVREDFKRRAEECVTILDNLPDTTFRPDFIAGIAELLGASMAPASAKRVFDRGSLAENRRSRRAAYGMSAHKVANLAREASREADTWAGFGQKMKERDEWPDE